MTAATVHERKRRRLSDDEYAEAAHRLADFVLRLDAVRGFNRFWSMFVADQHQRHERFGREIHFSDRELEILGEIEHALRGGERNFR